MDEGVAAPGSLARNIHKVQTSKVGTGGELARLRALGVDG